MAIITITPPAVEPVTVDELKAHLGITTDSDDALIGDKLTAARQFIESQLGHSLLATVKELLLDAFPAGNITLADAPVIGVTSVKYLAASDGLEATLATDNYAVDTASNPARIAPGAAGWPSTDDTLNAVRVRYTAGYGDEAADVPADIREAIKQLAAHFYENREAAVVGLSVALLPLSVGAVLRERRNYSFA